MPRKKSPATPPPAAVAPEPIAVPAPIPPAVLELQADIVELVRSRSSFRNKVAEQQAIVFSAQAQLQAAQAELQGIDQEVQYRMGLAAQMQGKPVEPPQPFLVQPPTPGVGQVSSVPTRPQPGFTADPSDLVNHGHAVRDAL